MEELIKIQNRLKAPKNLYNKYGGFYYRNAESILTAVKPLLEEYGCLLLLTDDIVEVGGRVYVKATATITAPDGSHVSVEAFSREPQTKKGMDEGQVTGATSSYARKYALNGLFLIDDVKDPDTDEYRTEAENRAKKEQEIESKPIGKTKGDALRERCEKDGLDLEKVLAMVKADAFENITEYNHAVLIKNWEKMKERCKSE